MTRREFASGLTLAGTAALLGVRPETASAEPPPETTTIKLVRMPGICVSPQYLAEPLLQVEGFSDVRYVKKSSAAEITPALVSGEADISMTFTAEFIIRLDAGDPIVLLGGGSCGLSRAVRNEPSSDHP